MRRLATIVGLSAVLALFAGSTAAQAVDINANLVDGKITVGDTSCTWVNASTSANPPSSLSIDRSTVDLTCTGDASDVTLNNNPNVTFNDAAGTALVDKVSVTAVVFGISCSYEATNVTATRSGDTRTYTASGFPARKTGGGFLCPGDTSDTAAEVSFH
ncbi:MAG: hypothetical protein ACRDUA_22110 [Micromonosporaceae bacterium]